jgi:STE24 endopeptidase
MCEAPLLMAGRVVRFWGPPPYRPFDATLLGSGTNVQNREGAGGEPRQDPARNRRRNKHKLHPLLDEQKQLLARRYEKEKRLLGLAGTALSLVLLLAFYFSGLSWRLAHSFSGGSIIPAFLAYVGVLLAWMSVLSLPLSYYAGYIHEHNWNFSTQTTKSWLLDQAKSYGVSFVLGSLLLALLLWVMALFPESWWLIAGLGSAFVSVILATLFPIVVLPIFHRYVPIRDEELTDSLQKILAQEGLKGSGFYKEDMSRKTRKENAFLAGLGKTRRVVLGDNLVDNMTNPEVVSIIAHEVGHYKHRHMWKGIALGTVQQVIVFYFLHLIMKAAFPEFLLSTHSTLSLLPLLIIIAGAVSGFLFGPFGNALSRRMEKAADHYAITHIEQKTSFLTALAGLADRNLANAYPTWWVKVLYYSHPPIGERLEMLERFVEGGNQ